jgi:DNA modification methylase
MPHFNLCCGSSYSLGKNGTMIELNTILQGDSLKILKTLPDNSIDCCVTSPPYYGLRDYGHSDQIGLEETPELYVEKLVKILRDVKRVLKPEGTLWLNLGDSYSRSGKGIGSDHDKAVFSDGEIKKTDWSKTGLKPKDLIGIPWLVAFALRSDGWYLRQDIIWHKPNPMTESVTDRCTKSHEYIFLLSKSAKYYFDQEAIKQPVADASIIRLSQQIKNQAESNRVPGKTNGNMKAVGPGRKPRPDDNRGGNQGTKRGIPAMAINGKGINGHSGYFDSCGNIIGNGMANKKSVWTVTTKPFKEAHFATYPEDLIVDCIKAGCPENGIVLDPFMGAGTTGLVARKLNRNYIGIELNPDYIKIAEARIYNEIGLFQRI